MGSVKVTVSLDLLHGRILGRGISGMCGGWVVSSSSWIGRKKGEGVWCGSLVQEGGGRARDEVLLRWHMTGWNLLGVKEDLMVTLAVVVGLLRVALKAEGD